MSVERAMAAIPDPVPDRNQARASRYIAPRPFTRWMLGEHDRGEPSARPSLRQAPKQGVRVSVPMGNDPQRRVTSYARMLMTLVSSRSSSSGPNSFDAQVRTRSAAGRKVDV